MKTAWLAAAAALSITSQPVLAADAFRDFGGHEQRNGAFAGFNLKVPLGTRAAARPSARFQLTTVHEHRSLSGVRSYRPAGFEFGLTAKGKPDMFVGGARLADTEKRLGLTGGTDWLLPVALLGAVIVGVVLLTDGDNDLPEQQPI